jgi:L-ascorbate metabolism protein UlaG (beta-lactamase superfamily)
MIYYYWDVVNMKESIIKVNCHSSICIKYNNKTIYIDPYKIDKITNDADYIFITHSHYDHLSIEDINKICNENTRYIIPESDKEKLDKDNILSVIPNNNYTIDDIEFSTIPSYNKIKPFHRKSNNWVGYILNLDNKIYIAGDTDITEENKQVKCDIALVPIGGVYTMNYKEAAKLINTIKPKKAIPIHYGTIVGDLEDGNKFASLVDSNIVIDLPY